MYHPVRNVYVRVESRILTLRFISTLDTSTLKGACYIGQACFMRGDRILLAHWQAREGPGPSDLTRFSYPESLAKLLRCHLLLVVHELDSSLGPFRIDNMYFYYVKE